MVGKKLDNQLIIEVTDLLQMGLNEKIRENMIAEINTPENCKRLDVLNNVNRNNKKCKIRRFTFTAHSKTTYKRIYSMDSLIKAKKNETEIPSRQDILSSLSKSLCHPAENSHEIDLRRRKISELKDAFKPFGLKAIMY